jgi:hypothetical protein
METLARLLLDPMKIDTDKIDDAVLALLYLTLHEDCRAWKSFDWDAMNRLHEKGFISNPVGKAKSVVLTEKGLQESERLFQNLYAKREP